MGAPMPNAAAPGAALDTVLMIDPWTLLLINGKKPAAPGVAIRQIMAAVTSPGAVSVRWI